MGTLQIDRAPATAASMGTIDARVVDAMLVCIGRWGVAKTTADDIARAAGISRATLYRAFPGGRDTLFEALLRHEAARFFSTVTAPLERATDLEDLIVIGAIEANEFLRGHQALGFVLAHEPELVLPAFAFHRLDRVLAVAVSFVAPQIGRFVAQPAAATQGAEWVVRLLLSYIINPSQHLDLANRESVRSFVRTYVVPAIHSTQDIAPKER